MRTVVGGVFLALSLATPALAQDGLPPLERIIDIRLRVPVTVGDCTVPSTVEFLARRFELAAGVEYMVVECARLGGRGGRAGGPTVDLYGLTIADALTKLLALDPRYKMTEYNGVIVVRPTHAMSDPKNVLNFGSGSFALEDVTLGIALDALLSAITGETASTDDRYPIATQDGARRFNVKTGAISAVGALEAVVRAHGRSFWIVRHTDIGRLVSFYTFDGSGAGSSRRGLH